MRVCVLFLEHYSFKASHDQGHGQGQGPGESVGK